jgi:hypothetical protein
MRNYFYGVLSAIALVIITAATPALFGVEVGGTGIRAVTDQAVLVGRGGSAALVATVIPGCAQLGWNPSTKAFVCNATSTTTTSTSSTTTTT